MLDESIGDTEFHYTRSTVMVNKQTHKSVCGDFATSRRNIKIL